MLSGLSSGWILGLAMLALACVQGIRAMREFRRGKKTEAVASCLKVLGILLMASIGFFGPQCARIGRLGEFERAHRLLDALVACGAAGCTLYITGIALSIYGTFVTRTAHR